MYYVQNDNRVWKRFIEWLDFSFSIPPLDVVLSKSGSIPRQRAVIIYQRRFDLSYSDFKIQEHTTWPAYQHAKVVVVETRFKHVIVFDINISNHASFARSMYTIYREMRRLSLCTQSKCYLDDADDYDYDDRDNDDDDVNDGDEPASLFR